MPKGGILYWLSWVGWGSGNQREGAVSSPGLRTEKQGSHSVKVSLPLVVYLRPLTGDYWVCIYMKLLLNFMLAFKPHMEKMYEMWSGTRGVISGLLRMWFSPNHMLSSQCFRGLRERSFKVPLCAAVTVHSCERWAVPVTNWLVTSSPVCWLQRTVFTFRTVSGQCLPSDLRRRSTASWWTHTHLTYRVCPSVCLCTSPSHGPDSVLMIHTLRLHLQVEIPEVWIATENVFTLSERLN